MFQDERMFQDENILRGKRLNGTCIMRVKRQRGVRGQGEEGTRGQEWPYGIQGIG